MTVSRDKREQTIEEAARTLLVSGHGPLDFEGIRWTVERAGITNAETAVTFARRVIDCALSIFDSEIAPLIAFARPAGDACYARCSPKGRCARDFGFGIVVEHSSSGSHWVVGGREYARRWAAERDARRAVLLIRLRSDVQRKPEFQRRRTSV